MLVVPVSFGFMAFFFISVVIAIGLMHLVGAITTIPPRTLRVGPQRPPVRLTWGHRAFATAVPIGVILIIAALVSHQA